MQSHKPSTAGEVSADIEARIVSGSLRQGERLPSVRLAAKELGLATNTVAAAYRKLAERGLVFGDGRRGTFVANRAPIDAPLMQATPSGLIDLSSGNPDPELLPDIAAAVRRITVDHVRYGDPPLDGGLGSALSKDLASDLRVAAPDGLEPGETLAVVGGALDGIERTLMAHLRPGDPIAIEDPGYSSVLRLVRAMSLRPIPMPVDGFGPEPDALASVLDRGVRAVVITPRAQNPTGAALDQDRAAALSAIAAERADVLIIEDDHAGPIAGEPHRSIIGPSTLNWAVIRSVAKTLGPDLRLAALAGDRTTVGRVIGRQLLGTGWVSHLLQRTVGELLASKSTAQTLNVAAETYRLRRLCVVDALAEHGIPAWGRTGLNVWVPVPDEGLVVAGMQQRGYAVLPGARFRQRSGPAVRVSVGSSDPDVLAASAKALVEVLEAGSPGRSA